jgi:hypothetical protein
MTLVMLSLSLAAGCSSGRGGGTSASCAYVIEVSGVRYVAGRGDSPIAQTGAVLHGSTTPCDDGAGLASGGPTTARAIPGINTTDAVAAGNVLMLAARLWTVPREAAAGTSTVRTSMSGYPAETRSRPLS